MKMQLTLLNFLNIGLKRDKDTIGTLDSGRLEIAPKNVYNGGGYITTIKDEMKNESVDSTWKQMTSQAGLMATRPRVDPYSKVVLNGDNNLGLGGVIYADQNQQNNMINMNGSFNMTQQTQDYNIPVSSTDPQYQYMKGSPYSDSQSPYNISQPSPDSTGLANMNIASPLMDQNSLNTIGILSPKITFTNS